MDKVVIKMGMTPSNAPFRVSNIRTFIYIYSILLHYSLNNYKTTMIFQIDDTNKNKRLHTDDEIIDFYKTLGILNTVDGIEKIITRYELEISAYEYYYEELKKLNYIVLNDDGVGYFNINKYIEEYGSEILVDDLVYGKIKFNVNDLSDNGLLAIRRSDGSFLYHFVSSVDSARHGLTHIVRGNNKLMSSAYQFMIMRSLKISIPEFIHLPLLLENDKRKNIFQLLDEGYDFQPIINYLMSSGYGDSNNIYINYEEFSKNLNIKKFHKKNSYFDINILKKTQARYYKNVSYDEYERNIFLTNYLRNNGDCINYLPILYKYALDYEKILDYQHLFSTDEKDVLDVDEYILVDTIIDLLEKGMNVEKIIEQLGDKNKRKIYELVQWVFTGKKYGTSSKILQDIYMNSNIDKKQLRKLRKK